jgi:hypothetical protein
VDDYHKKTDLESSLEDRKGYIKTLEKLKSDFAKIRKEGE